MPYVLSWGHRHRVIMQVIQENCTIRKHNYINLQKSMLGRISTSVVSQISSSLFSPSTNQLEIEKI